MSRVFVDSSVLVRYFAADDPARAFAAAALIDGEDTIVVSSTAILELVHVMRTQFHAANPLLADTLVAFLARENVELADADRASAIAAIRWSTRASARRIADALLAAAAERAGCAWIATFDESMASPSVPVRAI